MSCNQPLYLNEEQACRDTFLKDAEGANIPFYFYKGVSEEHPEPGFDEEAHTLYVNAPDGLGGTGRKTAAAFKAALDLDFDYLIKTNVSTYLNINNIVNGMKDWPGRDDLNIYGGRYIINRTSKKVPFPRGYFTVLSKGLTEGMMGTIGKLSAIEGMPKTDDTLICLASLYYMQKELEESYTSHIMQVPSVIEWTDNAYENPAFERAFAIRCKDEKHKERTPDNIRKVHRLIRGEEEIKRMNYVPATTFETGMGLMDYPQYIMLEKAVELVKEMREKKDKTPPTP